MDSYVITNATETIELESFCNFKLSEKMVKSTTWYEYEPQRLEFTVYGLLSADDPTDWQFISSQFYNYLLNAMNDPHNNFKGLFPDTIIKLKKNGAVIFTGYIDLTQSRIDEEDHRADIVCYDILKAISLLSEDKVPYGKYNLGDFLNNDFYSSGSIFSAFDFDLSGKLSRLGFSTSLLFSGNTLSSQVTEYIYGDFNNFAYNYYTQYFKGFYIYDAAQSNRTISHLFFVYFQINLVSRSIIKNIKIFEIVNGYCPVDALYESDDIVTYSTDDEAAMDIDIQISDEVAAINDEIKEWGDNWFALSQIQDSTVIFEGYSYTYEDSDNNLSRRIEVTGNIFPAEIMIGDSSKFHQPVKLLGNFTKPNYSDKSWVEVLKDFLIGNNLVMKVTGAGNIEIKNISVMNAIDMTDSLIEKERKIQLPVDFDGLGSLDGDTSEMIDNFILYYYNYLKLLNVYDIKLSENTINTITRGLDVLACLSYSSKYYLILKIFTDIDKGQYECEAIEVST
jgi:hypothetical protein